MAAILKAIADLNVSPFEAAMGRMEQRAGRFASGQLAAIGRGIGAAFSVYSIGRFVGEVGKAADDLDDLSKATGVGVENLQALNVLFQQNGKNAGDVSGVLSRLKKSMDEATVNPNIAQSFQKLGIAFEDVARLSPDRILEMIAKAMQNAAGDMRAGEAAGNLLGRGYAELQGIMSELATQGLDPLRESLKSTNQIMGEDSVKAAAEAYEAYERLSRQVKTTLSSWLVAGAQRVQYAAALLGSGFDSEIATKQVYGGYDEKVGPDAATVAASTAAMRAAAAGRRDKAMAAAQQWYNEAVGKITVGNVTAADSLARIGGYVGGQSNPAVQIAERQLKIAELQKELQERIAKASETAADAGQRTVAALEE
jgi:hypothetical protein